MKKWVLVLELQDGVDLDRFPIAASGFTNREGPWKVLKAIEEAKERTVKEAKKTGEDLDAEVALLAACTDAVKKIQLRL